MANPSDTQPQTAPPPIQRLLAPVRLRLFCAAAVAGIGQGLTLVPLAGVAQIGRQALAPEAQAVFSTWDIVMASIAALVLGLACLTLAEVLAHLADNALTDHVRNRVTDRLMHVSLGWFTSRSAGSVKQALQDDMHTLHELTAHYFTTRARCAAAIGLAGLYLAYVDWRLAAISLAPFPLYYLIFGRAKRAISPERMARFVGAQTGISSAVEDFSRAMPVLRTFGTTGQGHATYERAVHQFLDAFLYFTRPLVAPLANANALITPVSVVSVVLTAGVAFIGLGWLPPADLLPFLLIAPGISAPMLLMGFMGHGLAHATAAAERIDALLALPPLPEPPADARATPRDMTLRFEGVSYAYDNSAPTLCNFNLTLHPGTVTAIVGPSGAGKSTVARLALRFFDPSAGRITLGGADLRDIGTTALYRHIGFVLQEVQLLHASLHDNIALGRPDASRADVEAAARTAQIHNRICALPQGYDTVIGREADLSGGEAQRVSIARAVLLGSPLLVIDEGTAALDGASERALQEALSDLTRERSLLVIAHRLDTITTADQIVVLDQGRVMETGTHAALLAAGGRYAALWAQGGYAMPQPHPIAEGAV